MSKQITYNRSAASVEQLKQYQRRKGRAKQYVWKHLQDEHPQIFRSLIEDFNETQAEDEQFEVKR